MAACRRRIERAVRGGEPVCDLSDLGDESAWGRTAYGRFVRWT